MSVVNIDTVLGNIGNKYDVTNHVDGMQQDPSKTSQHFKQEYTVIIRKKKYYAITALEGNDAYIRMYQIDNYTSINTNINVNGTNPGTCKITLTGNSKVICAERNQQDENSWGEGEQGFFNMLSGWSESIEDSTTTLDANGNFLYNNMMFDNVEDMKKMKYGYRIAEKCDFEPMDEIYVYGKSRREKEGDKYKVYQIFFGYINEVTKSFSAGSMPTISISAVDHLKLLQISYVANTPALFNNIASVGAHYDTDYLGNIIVDDNPYSQVSGDNDPELAGSFFTNVFAGRYPYEIVAKCARDAGIPEKFLQKRVEQVKRIPFLPELKENFAEMFVSELSDRLHFCNEAATKLFMEFYADEEGNLVFKIPNYTLGVNQLSANNAYIDEVMTEEEKKAAENSGVHDEEVTETVTTYETVTETITESITHTVVRGDTLWDLAYTYLGDSLRWPEIYENNTDIIADPHWIYPGQVLYIKRGTESTKQVEKQQQITTTKKVDGGSLSSVTDKFIPVINDNEIVSFVLTDNDNNICNCFEITQELGEFGNAMGQDGALLTKRAVQDWGSIIRFGMRPAKMVSTPLLDENVGPILFGTLMVQRSLSQRYKGTLTMIEDSSIRVGNPIRLFMYDEHPYKFESSQLNNGKQQAVFYVESISRDIKPSGVSLMTLTLTAGRVMGMESIYDKMRLLYGKYYEEYPALTFDQSWIGYKGVPGYNKSGGASSSLADSIVEYAKTFLGVPYTWGGKSPSTGMDCSGFVAYVMNHFADQLEINSSNGMLDSYTHTMMDQGKDVTSDFPNNLRKADIVFPHTEHVQLYIGDGQVIHSPGTGDVIKISDLRSSAVKVIRVVPDSAWASSGGGGINAAGYSDAYVEVLKSFEGYFDHWYDDGKGNMTIGYGIAVTGNLGKKLWENGVNSCNEAQATEWMKEELNEWAEIVTGMVNKRGGSLSQSAFDVAVDIKYQWGGQRDSIINMLIDGDIEGAKSRIMNLGYPRRDKTRCRMLDGDYSLPD